MNRHTRFLLLVALSVIAACPARAQTKDMDALHTDALWATIKASPDLKDVDQIVIVGDAGATRIEGWLEKRNWLSGQQTTYWKMFWATFDQKCLEARPDCVRVTGIWSNGERIAKGD